MPTTYVLLYPDGETYKSDITGRSFVAVDYEDNNLLIRDEFQGVVVQCQYFSKISKYQHIYPSHLYNSHFKLYANIYIYIYI